VANVDLASYDGSAGYLVDSNVWIDCIDPSSQWHDWAIDQLQACSERAPLHINLVIYTELLVPEPDIAALDTMLDVFETQRTALPWAGARLAAKAFGVYRRRGGLRRTPLPDFFIGAHAAVANFAVLTRDPKPYRAHFPRLSLIAPA
jgi:predicted nucleic acid-binding protein